MGHAIMANMKYVAKPNIVDAYVVKRVEFPAPQTGGVSLLLEDGRRVWSAPPRLPNPPPRMSSVALMRLFDPMIPKAGDYYLRHEDGSTEVVSKTDFHRDFMGEINV
jgi:hypothetical protein